MQAYFKEAINITVTYFTMIVYLFFDISHIISTSFWQTPKSPTCNKFKQSINSLLCWRTFCPWTEFSYNKILVTSIAATSEVAEGKMPGISISLILSMTILSWSLQSTKLSCVWGCWSAIHSLSLIINFTKNFLAELATNMLLSEIQSNACITEPK